MSGKWNADTYNSSFKEKETQIHVFPTWCSVQHVVPVQHFFSTIQRVVRSSFSLYFPYRACSLCTIGKRVQQREGPSHAYCSLIGNLISKNTEPPRWCSPMPPPITCTNIQTQGPVVFCVLFIVRASYGKPAMVVVHTLSTNMCVLLNHHMNSGHHYISRQHGAVRSITHAPVVVLFHAGVGQPDG